MPVFKFRSLVHFTIFYLLYVDNLHPFIPVNFIGEHSSQPESTVYGRLKVCCWGFTQFGIVYLFFYDWLREERHHGWLFQVESSDATKSFKTLQKSSHILA